MLKIQLSNNRAFSWYRTNNIYAKGYIYTNNKLIKNENLACYFSDYFSKTRDIDEIKNTLKTINGIFAVVIEIKNKTHIISDRYNSFPLFYKTSPNHITITDDVYAIPHDKLNEQLAWQYTAFGYTLGSNTLINNLYRVQAGEIVSICDDQIQKEFYHFQLSNIKITAYEESIQQLQNAISKIIHNIQLFIENRPVLLALSAGLDSRLVAYMLKKAGIENVHCFTYGSQHNNPEIAIAQEVAKRLNYKWSFINYSEINSDAIYQNDRFTDYCKFAMQYSSKVMFITYFAAHYFENQKKESPTPIVMSGLGGDLFSGKELLPFMKDYNSLKTIAKDLQYKYCDLRKMTTKECRQATQLICNQLNNSDVLFQNFENWNLKEYYSKLIGSWKKTWEFSNFITYTPLHDNNFSDFFNEQPFEYRLYQKLYREVLNILFAEFDINFATDNNNIIQPHPSKTYIKNIFKRCIPTIRTHNQPFQNNAYDQHRFYKTMQEENNRINPSAKKAISTNGILAQWLVNKAFEIK